MARRRREVAGVFSRHSRPRVACHWREWSRSTRIGYQASSLASAAGARSRRYGWDLNIAVYRSQPLIMGDLGALRYRRFRGLTLDWRWAAFLPAVEHVMEVLQIFFCELWPQMI